MLFRSGGKLFAIVPAEESQMMSYPNWDVGGHPPLRGSPIYPVGHPGYFNGRHIPDAAPLGYTGGPSDTYGMYPGAGNKGVAEFL